MRQTGRVDGLENVVDPGGRVAVDPLFVLEHEGHATLGRTLGDLAHAAHHLGSMPSGIIARRHVEAEDPNPGRLVKVGQLERAGESVQVGFERVVDLDLPDRRSQSTEPKPARVEQLAKLLVLRVAQVQDIGAVNGPELDVANSVLAQDRDLLERVLGNLVGKGTQADHRQRSCLISVRSNRKGKTGLPRMPAPCRFPPIVTAVAKSASVRWSTTSARVRIRDEVLVPSWKLRRRDRDKRPSRLVVD